MLKRTSLILAILLLSACGPSGSPSKSELESLMSQAKLDVATGNYKDAEKKLLDCIRQAEKDSYVKLAALNYLVDVEVQLKNDSRAKSLTREACYQAEEFCRTGMQNSNDLRMYEHARRALFRWADAFMEVGTFDPARTLYSKALILEQKMGSAMEPQADERLRKLDEQVSSETRAIEHEDGLLEKNDPRFIARAERTAARKKLMQFSKSLHDQMMRKPDKATADKILALLPKVRTTFGIRESEYRASLENAATYAASFGNRARAIALLKEDLSNFENIPQEGVDRADPTTLENASFAIADLGQLAGLISQDGDLKEALRLAQKGCALAGQVHSADSRGYADCLKEAAIQLEKLDRRAEAIPLRERQLAMLKRLKLTDDYLPYYQGWIEQSRNLHLTGNRAEALPRYNYAISRMHVNLPDKSLIAYTFLSKAELLLESGEWRQASDSIAEAKKIYDKIGDDHQRYVCAEISSTAAFRLNSIAQARQFGEEALKYAEKLKNSHKNRAIATACMQLSKIEGAARNSGKAQDYGKRALEYQIKCDGENSTMTAGCLNNLADVQQELGNKSEALNLKMRALAICKRLNIPGKLSLISTTLQVANLHHKNGQKDKAIPMYREAIALAKSSSNTSAEMIQYRRLARVQLGQIIAATNSKEAERLKDEVVAKTADYTNGTPIDDASFFMTLSDLCIALKDFKNAEVFLEKTQKLIDSNAFVRNRHAVVLSERKKTLYNATKGAQLTKSVE